MITPATVPVEEYLRTTYEPDMEYVDGQLVERHVGEYDHSRFQALVAAELGAGGRQRRFRIFIAARVRVSNGPKYRIPDVCVKALPHESTPILVRPDLVIEIVSPDDTPVEMLQKIGDYQAAGIPYIWGRRSVPAHTGRSGPRRDPAAVRPDAVDSARGRRRFRPAIS
jgi:Uma2 family endonuclease